MNPSTTSDPDLSAAASAMRIYGVFLRQGQFFGVEVSCLREVVHRQHLTRVPHAPALFAGVFNLRGEIVPVVMIDTLLGLPPVAFEPSRPIVILRRKDLALGVQVDSMDRVISIPADEVLPNPLAARQPCLSGLHYSMVSKRVTTLIETGLFLDEIRGHATRSLPEGGIETVAEPLVSAA